MSGNFILRNISATEVYEAKSFVGASFSTTAHEHIGWTQESKQALADGLANKPLANRNNLPPHVYLEIKNTSPQNQALTYLQNASWIDKLERPTHMGLKALAAGAVGYWSRGDKHKALLEQLKTGPISIEIYSHNHSRI